MDYYGIGSLRYYDPISGGVLMRDKIEESIDKFPSLKEFLQICDPLLLVLLGDYLTRLIPKEKGAPELHTMRLLINLEAIERSRKPGSREEVIKAFEELPSLFESTLSKYPGLRDSSKPKPGEGAS